VKFLIFKKKFLYLNLIGLVVIALLCTSTSKEVMAQVYFGDNVRKTPIYRVDNSQGMKVAISFDAAWGADKTEGIMEVLKSYGVNATFFLVGFWVEKYPDLTKKISENGFEIGTHSYNHPDMVKLNKNQMKEELISSCDIIEKTTQKKVKLFRPPYGSYNNTLITTCEELNLQAIQWDVDTLDWKGLKPNEVLKRVNSKIKSGSIILCHNNADYVIESTKLILERLKSLNYQVVSVGELVGIK
jgi:peptidoglycan-N-acetylglucosamine deacetylase